jgi:hypothetical protein
VGNPTKEPNMVAPIKSYDTKLDSKSRLTVRGAKARFYAVKVFSDGHVLLSPRRLVALSSISRKTLRTIEQSLENMIQGRMSVPIDIALARKLFSKKK